MSEIHYGRGYVYSIQYHLVWCVKYRHDVLIGQVDTDVKELLQKIAIDNDVQIVEMESDKDHIHLLIECKPQHYIPSVVKAFKGVSARFLFKKHPELKKRLWGGHLWNPSYFVATVSENTEEQIRQYIQNQKKK
ncbi:transposase IS200-family protein (plasmid) [Paenibacillus larvae subsp. larvae]|uniref:Transposase n=2 Tax=root TaxID=1 RepID=A0A345AZS5_9CAUD|nr:IS200/IS605 family transposase [Paenibacillus larvae]YP_010082459.1 transposase [Paenibacillus phage Unity]AQT87029.1 IS200/IS605 family transposase [Paenibacillus larvae subsp. pulvifaciens]AQZ49346.1 IS200/IS605 family transposase [Paenibacillus larvae subsp. pulvifaciens]AVF28990.1 transposase IS200-family protein [Paenibacillus larvae subsp. larvae]AVF33371.1 transposase IS200-family protein [Paenibacillus larvae subsp. larvae]AXF42605.1 transposase [Paenibacillus phage Unity]